MLVLGTRWEAGAGPTVREVEALISRMHLAWLMRLMFFVAWSDLFLCVVDVVERLWQTQVRLGYSITQTRRSTRSSAERSPRSAARMFGARSAETPHASQAC